MGLRSAIVAAATAGGLLLGGYVGLQALSTAASVITAPSRVINRTMQTDNIIQNYEFFHDAYNTLQARVAQAKAHRDIIALTEDKHDVLRLRMELAAIQQSCRDLAARYNANATKTNRSIFMGRTAPESIHPSICE